MIICQKSTDYRSKNVPGVPTRVPRQVSHVNGRSLFPRSFLVSILQTAHLWANTGVVESCPSLG